MYLKARKTNHVNPQDLVDVPDSSFKGSIRRIKDGQPHNAIAIPAGIVVEVSEETGKAFLERGSRKRPHWEDVTKQVAAGMLEPSPVNDESGGREGSVGERRDPFVGIANPKQAQALLDAGYDSLAKLADAEPDDLEQLDGIGEVSARRLVEEAGKLVDQKESGE